MLLRSLQRCSFTFPIPRTLNEVARVPLLNQESPVKIRQMWLEQFKQRQDVVVGTMALSEFEQFKANTIACPMFLVPIMKANGSGGYFNLISQFQDGKHCLLTDLETFRNNPVKASPMMVITVYDELIREKQIALIRGDIINRLDITQEEAGRAIKFLRHCYTNKFPLVQRFNHQPREFEYDVFMAEAKQFFANCGGTPQYH